MLIPRLLLRFNHVIGGVIIACSRKRELDRVVVAYFRRRECTVLARLILLHVWSGRAAERTDGKLPPSSIRPSCRLHSQT